MTNSILVIYNQIQEAGALTGFHNEHPDTQKTEADFQYSVTRLDGYQSSSYVVDY
jgi:hypothetical protein